MAAGWSWRDRLAGRLFGWRGAGAGTGCFCGNTRLNAEVRISDESNPDRIFDLEVVNVTAFGKM
jgi:hypothetical protein